MDEIQPSGGKLLRELGIFDVMSLVVGTVIGSGIFLVPSEVAREVHSAGAMLGVWVFGGAFTMLGALSLAELGAAIPNAGGIYTYISRGFGRLAGFLCGWMLFTVATSGSIATLAVAFPIYLGALVPLTPVLSKLASLTVVIVFTAINLRGVRDGARVQNVLTALKIGGLLAMIAIVFLGSGSRPINAAPAAGGAAGFAGFGIALVAVLWAYEGWHDTSFVAGEIRDPKRTFPRGIIVGTAIVIALYLAANLAYLRVLSPAEIAGSPRVALTAIERVAGGWGVRLLSAAIVCSILGALNALILAGPRAYYQMAVDGLFFKRFAAVHPRWKTPSAAILLQAAWACCLIFFIGGFSQLFTYVIFGGWIFYALAVAAVIALRKREPALPRPFRVPGYPIVPILFVVAAAVMVVNTLVARPRESSIGLAFIALGIPLYFLRRAAGKTFANPARKSKL